MTEEAFWEIIKQSRKDFSPKRLNGNMERQLKTLKKLLKPLGPDELGQFDGHFTHFSGRAYHYDLWACAFLTEGGCGDDAFMDFRSWMVSMGKTAYEAMLEDADNLADFCDQPGMECIFFEEIVYAPNEVYTKAFDPEGIPDYYHRSEDSQNHQQGYPVPAGRNWSREDIEYFKTRFPRMWTKRCRISWPD